MVAMRVAWFSPLPPDLSGIAAYSADVLPLLDEPSGHSIDRFVDRPPVPGGSNVFNAHDFVWKHQLKPYDLVVYQLGNARWHDYMWAYLAAYPGLVVLHDTRLHHARARHLLSQGRPDDYRREFRYDHPDAPPGVEEFAVEGLAGSVYYLWSMLPVVLRTARLVAVHNARVASDLHDEHPDVRVDTIRMGVPPNLLASGPALEARARLRRELAIPDTATVFVAFGHVTPEKRIEPVLRGLAAGGDNAYLLLVGPADGMPSLQGLIARHGLDNRVRATGYVPDEQVAAYLAAADACLCLRWPTAGETSASWLRALAAGTPTVITALAHLADVPTLDATTGRRSHPSQAPVAISVDLLDEETAVGAAMARLSANAQLRSELASAGHAHWSHEHRIERMADDYRRVMREAAARPAPRADGLPSHFTDDYSALVRRLEEEMGVGARI
jgi:glycosyltransferase involved in cell wall biosynthesis